MTIVVNNNMEVKSTGVAAVGSLELISAIGFAGKEEKRTVSLSCGEVLQILL